MTFSLRVEELNTEESLILKEFASPVSNFERRTN
jgi:hypothetical protein